MEVGREEGRRETGRQRERKGSEKQTPVNKNILRPLSAIDRTKFTNPLDVAAVADNNN